MSINFKKQINYWRDSAQSDLESAEILLRKKKILQALFFCHLSIEKILKASIVKKNKDIAPKSHNLIFLEEKSDFNLDKETVEFLGVLMRFQIQGRYPDSMTIIPSEHEAKEIYSETKELFECLIQKF